MYLIDGGAVRSLTAWEAKNVSSCPAWLFLLLGLLPGVCLFTALSRELCIFALCAVGLSRPEDCMCWKLKLFLDCAILQMVLPQ